MDDPQTKVLPIALASDHGGFRLKSLISAEVKRLGLEVFDLGVFDELSADYPDQAKLLAERVLSGNSEKGVLVCGTGIGMSIAANRFKGIRAALCHDEYTARMSRLHNNANVLVLGGRVLGDAAALGILNVWLSEDFEGGRHLTRINKLEALG
ncbi:MAG: ribose 5-phosphate isomerase B [Deferribacteraceae bacterium]|jgi:ribose 5-phosphate isomerase B|nr:ribose 5-phosphate isomerase B [Deferribacteraceae bacterium]